MANVSANLSIRNPLARSRKQISALSQRGRNRAERIGGRGVRSDRVWCRKPEKLGEKPRSNAVLMDSIEYQYIHRGARMRSSERETLRELADRSYSVQEYVAGRLRAIPAWVATMLPPRRMGGYRDFLALVIASYRVGACGVWISTPEAMGAFACSVNTWLTWTHEMEDLGLIRVTKTTLPDDTGSGRVRINGTQHYRIGPALEEHAAALLEGAHDDPRSAKAKASRLGAIAARKAQRASQRLRIRQAFDSRAKCYRDQYRGMHAQALGADPAEPMAAGAEGGGCARGQEPTSAPQNCKTTPLMPPNNCDAIPPPKSGGNNHPRTTGVFDKAQPPPSAPAAIGSAGSAPLADPVDPATLVADLLARHGHRPRDIERSIGVLPTSRRPLAQDSQARSTPTDQPPVGRSANREAAAHPADRPFGSGHDLANSERRCPPADQQNPTKMDDLATSEPKLATLPDQCPVLHGPLAAELAKFFFSRAPLSDCNGSDKKRCNQE